MPLVSIGLPVYNGDAHLEEALDSILTQDFDDFELIISDNASSDRTQEICERYAANDGRVTYSRLPDNLGAAANYNRVFEMATGTYFKWAAHDDLLRPQFISTCVTEFERHDVPPVIVHPAAEFIDVDGSVMGRHEDRMHIVADQAPVRAFQVLQQLSMIAAVFGMFHRESLARTRLIGSFISSDYALLLEAAILGKIVFVDGDAQFQRRVHPGMSRQANTTDEEVLRWFDPKAKLSGNRMRRLHQEYLRSVRHIDDLNPLERAVCGVVVVAGVGFKSTRVRLGRWRRRLMPS